MSTEKPGRDSIFCCAIEIPSPAERAAYITRACGDDAELRREVDRLVIAHFQAGGFLAPRAGGPRMRETEQALPEPPLEIRRRVEEICTRFEAAWLSGQVPAVEEHLQEGPERPFLLHELIGLDVHYRLRRGEPIPDYPARFPEADAGWLASLLATSTPDGSVIGPYKLLQQLGEGGMGTVWMAAQTEPVKRTVALKLIKPGMDSTQVIARFEAERQALALMDHPNIARVFDAGTTANGRPYFVMELVKGVPITRYCDERRLTPRERLELFIPVCEAVQHAHQKGVIHRDIKPSNVLVALYDGRPVPKVIDFGIAKATGQKLTERTLFTGFGAVVGTLEYMSPEQAELNQLDIDTRSDVYSLGVLLYELLTGTTPLDRKRLKQAAMLEILRLIREDEPPRPSTRLSTTEELPAIAANRGLEAKKLSGLVKGELDWIVMKALEKDRNRRYETANAFAQDVERYLKDEPVQACPPSAGYRLRKFARRNKAALLTAGVIASTLVLATAVSTFEAVRATNAEQQAENQRISEGKARDALDAAREEEERQRARATGELNAAVVKAVGLREKVRTARPGDAAPLQQLRETVREAETLAASGLADPAVVESARKLLGELKQEEADRRMVARIEEIRGNKGKYEAGRFVLTSGREWQEYEAAFHEYGISISDLNVEEAARRIAASPIRDWLVAALDDASHTNSEFEERFLPIARRAAGSPWLRRYIEARARNDWAALLMLAAAPETLDQPPAAIVGLARALNQIYLANRATMHSYGAATIDLLRKARTRYPADWWVNDQLALALMNTPEGAISAEEQARRKEEIRGCYRSALAARPESSRFYHHLGSNLLRDGRYAEAASCYGEAVRLDPTDSVACDGLSKALWHQGEREAGVAMLRHLIELNPSDPLAYCFFGHAVLRRNGDNLWDDAAAYRKALESYPQSVPAFLGLGEALQNKGLPAVAAFEKAGELDPRSASIQRKLGAARQASRDLEGAVAAYSRAVELDPKAEPAFDDLGAALFEKKDLDGSVNAYRKAVALNPRSYRAIYGLASALSAKGNRNEAVDVYRRAIERNRNAIGLYRNLANTLLEIGKPDQAVDCLRKLTEVTPDSGASYAELDRALLRSGDRGAAFAAFHKATELNPSSGNIYSLFAKELFVRGDRDGILEVHRRHLELLPGFEQAHKDLADDLQSRGDLDGVVALYRKTLERFPKWKWTSARWAYRGLGYALLRKEANAAQDDVVAIRKALELFPKRAAAHACLGEALQRKGDVPGGVEAFKQAGLLEPESASIQEGLGAALQVSALIRESRGDAMRAKGDRDEAIAAYRHATELDPTSHAAYVGLAVGLRAKGDLPGAIAAYRRATELNPESTWDYLGLAVALQEKGDLDGVINVYRGAADFFPGWSGAYHGWAGALRAKGDLDGAIEVYHRAIWSYRDFAKDSEGFYQGLSDTLRAKSDVKGSIDVYRRAAELFPTSDWPYTRWISALEQQGDKDGIVEAHRRRTELQPKEVWGYTLLGDALKARGDLGGAIAAYRAAIELRPRSPEYSWLYFSLGNLLRAKGELDKAIAAYETAIELSPSYYTALDALAWLLATSPDLKLRDPRRAVELAQKAVRGVRGNTPHTYYTTLGMAHYRLGDAKAAIEALNHNQPSDPVAWLFLALSHEKLGDHDEARKWYDKAMKSWEYTMKNEAHRADELRRFREEVEEALGLKKK